MVSGLLPRSEQMSDDLINRLAIEGEHKYVLELEAKVDLLYRMARHIRNTDEMAAIQWGVKGMDLLAALRELDHERYDAEVKANDTIPKIAAAPPEPAQAAPEQGVTDWDRQRAREALTDRLSGFNRMA